MWFLKAIGGGLSRAPIRVLSGSARMHLKNIKRKSSVFDGLDVRSPKRSSSREPVDRLYPYYAGFPESFVRALLASGLTPPGSLIFDPWNGSGTTTCAAAYLGFPAIGFDLNPVMVIVAKARLLPASETPSLCPLAREIVKHARAKKFRTTTSDPLNIWFHLESATAIRSLERSCCEILIGSSERWRIEEMSSIAATFYTALFSITRKMASAFQSANPTWIKRPKRESERVSSSREEIEERFVAAVDAIARLISNRSANPIEQVMCRIEMADATMTMPKQSVDLVITSPPYCTRIDYAAATRVELALIGNLVSVDYDQLRLRMVGTTKVPDRSIEPAREWGSRSLKFLNAVQNHSSKASKGYYYLTHLDYFDKLAKSLDRLAGALRTKGVAVLIVQDSFYKDIHNDLPTTITQMAGLRGLEIRKRVNFASPQCMSRINSRAVSHESRNGSTEAVLFFVKE